MDKVSIVIPTLNEEDNINALLERVFNNCKPEKTEVIFVDDNSSDATRTLIRNWQKSYPVRLICRDTKKGLSSAVTDGAKKASGDIVVVMDADLSHPPESIPSMISQVIDGGSDMVIGSRYVAGGSTPDWPLSRKITSKTATIMAKPFTSAADPMSGFFAVKKELFSQLKKEVPGFKIGLELLATGRGKLKVSEVPIEFLDRTSGISKLGCSVIFSYFFQLAGLALHALPFNNIINGLIRFTLSCLADVIVITTFSKAGVPVLYGHIAGFAAFIVVFLSRDIYYLLTGGRESELMRKMVFPVILLALLFLRGGILTSFLQLSQWTILSSVLVSDIILTLLCSVGVYYFKRTKNNPSERQACLILILAAYAFALKISYMGIFELMHQEAYYWNYAMHTSIGYLDHPPMVAWIIWFFSTLFGSSEMAVRAGAPICWLITAAFTYKLTKRLFDRNTALVSVFLLSSLPFYFGIGMLMTPDAPLSAAWAGTLYFLYKALLDDKRSAWILAGLCLGVGLLSKYTIILLVPSTALLLVIDSRYRKWFLRPEPYLALGLALTVFLPVIVWNAENQWASFNFQGARRFNGNFDFSSPELLLSMAVLLTPVGLLAVFSSLRFSLKQHWSRHNNHQDMKSQSHLFFLIYTLVPLSVFLFFSLVRKVKLNWTGPLWLVLIPLLSWFIVSTVNTKENTSRLFSVKVWSVSATVTILLFGTVLYYLTIGIPGISLPNNIMLVGWGGLGKNIEDISRDVEVKRGEKPIVVGLDKYKTASGLAFYRTKAFQDETGRRADTPAYNTSGRHLLGRGSLMYEYWFPIKDYEKRDMILVSTDREELIKNNPLETSATAGGIVEIPLTRNGKNTGSVFYKILRKNTRHLWPGGVAIKAELPLKKDGEKS